MSRTFSSAGIKVEKARNTSILSDDAETPVYIEGGSGNRQVGLKPSVATYTTISADCDNTCSSLIKPNVVVIAAQTTNNAASHDKDLNG